MTIKDFFKPKELPESSEASEPNSTVRTLAELAGGERAIQIYEEFEAQNQSMRPANFERRAARCFCGVMDALIRQLPRVEPREPKEEGPEWLKGSHRQGSESWYKQRAYRHSWPLELIESTPTDVLAHCIDHRLGPQAVAGLIQAKQQKLEAQKERWPNRFK